MLQEKEFAVSRCCEENRQGDKFSVSHTMLQEKGRAKKLTSITVNQSVGAGQGRADFSPVNSLVGAGQGRARIYFSYKPC